MTLLQKIQRGAMVGLALTAFVGLALPGAKAQVSISPGTTVSQDFSIGTAQSALLPSGWRVAKSSSAQTILTYTGAGTKTEQVGGNNLSSTAANGIYNCGAGVASSAIDRAVGFLSSSSATKSGNLYVWLQNTGADISSLTISYDVEKYRQGSNPTGFSFQMYYSTDGSTWASAGSDFLTSFPADGSNNGYSSAPGVTVNVIDKTLSVSIPSSGNLYLAWNYSVTSGSTTSNAQCLAVDNVSITAVGAVGPTNPSGIGSANPASVDLGVPTTLSVTVTPGTNPDSSGITVTGDLSSIGGSSSQAFSNGGSGNVYTYLATPTGTAGTKSIPVTIADAESRSSVTNIALEVTQLLTVAQARAQGTGNVKVRGLVSAIHVGNVYITDADGGAGLMLYKSGWATAGSPWTDVQVGDDITATGPLSTYNNELEVNGVTSLVINSTGNTLPEPAEVTLPLSQADEGRLVTLKDLKIETAPTGPNTNFTFKNAVGATGTGFIHNNTTATATAWPGVPTPPVDVTSIKVGEYYTITGIQGDHTSGLQIKPRSGDDIVWLGKPLPPLMLGNGAIKSSPVAYNGFVYCGNNAGIMQSTNTTTGITNWEYDVPGVLGVATMLLGRPSLNTIGGIDYLFFTTDNGYVFCLEAETGAMEWSVGPLLTGATGVDTTPAVQAAATLADTVVTVSMFTGSEGYVYRLNGVNGATMAVSDDLITAASGGRLSSPSANGAGVFVSVSGGNAAGYRLIPGEATLTVSTQVALGKNSEQPPFIYNYWDAAYPRVLIAANDGTLSAFNATNGEIAYQNAAVSSGSALTFPVARRDGNVVYMAGANGIVYQANVADGTAPAGGYAFYSGASGTTIQGLAIDPAGIGGAATLVFGDSTGAFHKVPLTDASGAKVIKAAQTAGSVFATTPTIDPTGGMVLVGNDNSTVYGFARD